MKKSNPNENSDGLPPHSIPAEQGVLGCILMKPSDLLGDVMEALPDHHAFYLLAHRAIYDALVSLENERKTVDLILLVQRLTERGLLEQIGGVAYLNVIQDATPSAYNLPSYLEIVQAKFQMRRWLALCADISLKIADETITVDDLVGQVSSDMFKLCEYRQRASEKVIRQVIVDVQAQYLDKFERGKKHKRGPMTGFNYLDNILPGFGPGQLIVLAARPRTGKSALMMQMAEYIALVEKIPVAVFSLEMTAVSLGARAVFQRAGSDITKFLNGYMETDDVQRLVGATVALSPLPIWIDEAPRLSIEDMEIRCRRLVRRHNSGVIFIDYFQLMFVRNRMRQWSKSDELAECSMRLKGLAKELKVPIVLCAQMNREIEKETHRRPRLSDLRDTGRLEQDADVVMFLWKPDVSSDRKKKRIARILPRVPVEEGWRQPKTWQKELTMITCTVEKQREGRSGEDADLVFIKPWTRFVDAWRPGDIVETTADMLDDDEGEE